MASSWVMMPTKHVGGIDDRDGDQVVLADLAGDRLLVFVDAGEDHIGCMISPIPASGRARISVLSETKPTSLRWGSTT